MYLSEFSPISKTVSKTINGAGNRDRQAKKKSKTTLVFDKSAVQEWVSDRSLLDFYTVNQACVFQPYELVI